MRFSVLIAAAQAFSLKDLLPKELDFVQHFIPASWVGHIDGAVDGITQVTYRADEDSIKLALARTHNLIQNMVNDLGDRRKRDQLAQEFSMKANNINQGINMQKEMEANSRANEQSTNGMNLKNETVNEQPNDNQNTTDSVGPIHTKGGLSDTLWQNDVECTGELLETFEDVTTFQDATFKCEYSSLDGYGRNCCQCDKGDGKVKTNKCQLHKAPYASKGTGLVPGKNVAFILSDNYFDNPRLPRELNVNYQSRVDIANGQQSIMEEVKTDRCDWQWFHLSSFNLEPPATAMGQAKYESVEQCQNKCLDQEGCRTFEIIDEKTCHFYSESVQNTKITMTYDNHQVYTCYNLYNQL